MRTELAWSLIDQKPVFLYDPEYDAHLVFWNGVAMTRSYALLIYSKVWCEIYPSPSQKSTAWREYIQVYRSGAFKTKAWDNLILNYHPDVMINQFISFLVMNDPKFLIKLKEKYTAKEALSWFLPSRELVDKNIKI